MSRMVQKEERYVFPATLEYKHVSVTGKSVKDRDLVIRIEKMDLSRSLIPWSNDPVHVVLRNVRPTMPGRKGSLEAAMTDSVLNMLVIERFTTDLIIRPDHQSGSLPDFSLVNPNLTAHGSLSFHKIANHAEHVRLSMNFTVSGLLKDLLGHKNNTLRIVGDLKNPHIVLDGQTMNE